MEAGKHVTNAFEPAFHFEVGECWGFFFPETTDGRYMGNGPERSTVIFAKPVKVFDPSNPSEQKEVPAPESADEWISWFQKHPNLDVSNLVPASVGSVSGVRIDVTATSTSESFPEYYGEQPCVPPFPTARTPIVSFAAHVGFKDRFVIVNVRSKPVVIDVSAPADKFDLFLPTAQKVLDTVKWKGA